MISTRFVRVSPFVVLALLLLPVAGCESLGIGNPATNVLKQVDPTRDAVSGMWTLDGRKLQSEATQDARLALPVVPYGDYNLKMKFARVIGRGSANLIFPVGGPQVMLVIAGLPEDGAYSGLEYVSGRRNEIAIDSQFDLINHRVYSLDLTVRTQGAEAKIDVDIDGRPFVRWIGPHSELSLPPGWALRGGATLGIGSNDSVIQVSSLTVRTLPGEKEWVN